MSAVIVLNDPYNRVIPTEVDTQNGKNHLHRTLKLTVEEVLELRGLITLLTSQVNRISPGPVDPGGGSTSVSTKMAELSFALKSVKAEVRALRLNSIVSQPTLPQSDLSNRFGKVETQNQILRIVVRKLERDITAVRNIIVTAPVENLPRTLDWQNLATAEIHLRLQALETTAAETVELLRNVEASVRDNDFELAELIINHNSLASRVTALQNIVEYLEENGGGGGGVNGPVDWPTVLNKPVITIASGSGITGSINLVNNTAVINITGGGIDLSDYLPKSGNLAGLTNLNTARDNLSVYSRLETDSRYFNVTGDTIIGNSVLLGDVSIGTTSTIGRLTVEGFSYFNGGIETTGLMESYGGFGVYDGAFEVSADTAFINPPLDLGTQATLSTHAVRADRALFTNNGLTGGGSLASNRTFGLTGQALAFHNLATNGIVVRTGAGSITSRTLTGTTNRVTITNSDGIAGNPTFTIPQDYHTAATPRLGKLGLGVNAPAAADLLLEAAGMLQADGLYTTGAGVQLGSTGFASGFGGFGYRIGKQVIGPSTRYGIEADELTIRGRFNVYEIIAREISAVNGNLFISAQNEIESLSNPSGVIWHVYTKGPIKLTNQSFVIGQMLAPDYTSNAQFLGRVTGRNLVPPYLIIEALEGIPVAGMTLARYDHATEIDERGYIYIATSDEEAPFLAVRVGTGSGAWPPADGNETLRLGKLTGLNPFAAAEGVDAHGLAVGAVGSGSGGWASFRGTAGVEFWSGNTNVGYVRSDGIRIGSATTYMMFDQSSGQLILAYGGLDPRPMPTIFEDERAIAAEEAEIYTNSARESLALRLGYVADPPSVPTAWDAMVAAQSVGQTIITGGFINTNMIDAETITADHILVSSIDARDLNFFDSGTLVGTINADVNGIRIAANRIEISGTTVFTTGGANSTLGDQFTATQNAANTAASNAETQAIAAAATYTNTQRDVATAYADDAVEAAQTAITNASSAALDAANEALAVQLGFVADPVIPPGRTAWQKFIDATQTMNTTIISGGYINTGAIQVGTLSALSANLGNVNAGTVVITTGVAPAPINKIWLNDAGDGGLAIGGDIKATAPFRVTKEGNLTAMAGSFGGDLVGASMQLTGNLTLTGAGLISAGATVIGPSGVTITQPQIPTNVSSDNVKTEFEQILAQTQVLQFIDDQGNQALSFSGRRYGSARKAAIIANGGTLHLGGANTASYLKLGGAAAEFWGDLHIGGALRLLPSTQAESGGSDKRTNTTDAAGAEGMIRYRSGTGFQFHNNAGWKTVVPIDKLVLVPVSGGVAIAIEGETGTSGPVTPTNTLPYRPTAVQIAEADLDTPVKNKLVNSIAVSGDVLTITRPNGAGTATTTFDMTGKASAAALAAAETTIFNLQQEIAALEAGTVNQGIVSITNAGQIQGDPTVNGFYFRVSGDTGWRNIWAGQITLASAGTATQAVRGDRSILTGAGLQGGGDLTTDRTLSLTGQAAALHNLGTNGLIARTAAGAVSARTLVGTANRITVTNGDGVAGNPTLTLPQDIHTQASPTFAGFTVGSVTHNNYFKAGDFYNWQSPFGFKALLSPELNYLYAAEKRMTVTVTGQSGYTAFIFRGGEGSTWGAAAGTTTTMHIDLTAKGAYSSNGLTYVQSTLFIGYYHNWTPEQTRIRWRRRVVDGGAWSDWILPTPEPYVTGVQRIDKFALPASNYLIELEIEMTAQAGVQAGATGIYWMPGRLSGPIAPVNKLEAHDLWYNFSWFNSLAQKTVEIQPETGYVDATRFRLGAMDSTRLDRLLTAVDGVAARPFVQITGSLATESFRTHVTGNHRRIVANLPNAGGATSGYLFGIDGVQQNKGLVYFRDTGRVSLLNSGSDSNSTSYTERLTIWENGRVGIGTGSTQPLADLQISSSGGSSTIHLGDVDTILGSRLKLNSGAIVHTYGVNDGTATTNRGRFSLLSNVTGVVESGNDSGGLILRQNAGAWSAITGRYEMAFWVNGTSTNQNYDAYSAARVMTLTSSTGPRVGIGVAGPQTALHVQGSSPSIRIANTGNNTNYGEFRVDGANNVYLSSTQADMYVGAFNGGGSLYLRSNGQTQISLRETGNVGIGTTAPSTKLHVVGDTTLGGDTVTDRLISLYDTQLYQDTTISGFNLIVNPDVTSFNTNAEFTGSALIVGSDNVEFANTANFGGSIVPFLDWTEGGTNDIGRFSQAWRSLWVGEAHFNTLSIDNMVATEGGVHMTTYGASILNPLAPSGTQVYLSNNAYQLNHWVWIVSAEYDNSGSAVPFRELVRITAPDPGPRPTLKTLFNVGGVSGEGYLYTIARAQGGTTARTWTPNSSSFSTGADDGHGMVETVAVNSVLTSSAPITGPKTSWAVRTGPTPYEIERRVVAGNLNGTFGVNSNIYGFATGTDNVNALFLPDQILMRGGAADKLILTSSTLTFLGLDQELKITDNGISATHFGVKRFALEDGELILGPGPFSSEPYSRLDSSSITMHTNNIELMRIGEIASGVTGIRIGRVGAGLPNTYITSTSLQQRIDTTVYTELVGSQLILGRVGSTMENIKIDGASVEFRNNTTVQGSLSGTDWTLGATNSTNKNVTITPTGIEFRSGTITVAQLSGTTFSFGAPADNNYFGYNVTTSTLDIKLGGRNILSGSTTGDVTDIYLGDTGANLRLTGRSITIDGTTTFGSGFSPNNVRDAAVRIVDSRRGNLVTNGSAFLRNNTNFSQFTYNGSDAPYGSFGSFEWGSTTSAYFVDQKIPVDLTERYRVKFSYRNAGTGTGQMYSGVDCLDVDDNQILPWHVDIWPGSAQTYLTSDLNNGDTSIDVNSTTGWYNGTEWYWRFIAVYNYTSTGGVSYPDYTYTRNILGAPVGDIPWNLGSYPQGGVSGQEITLSVPYSGPTIPAGTAITNTASGSSYIYAGLAGTNVAPGEWEDYEFEIGPGASVNFRPGTSSFRFFMFANSITGGTITPRLGGVSVTPAYVTRNMLGDAAFEDKIETALLGTTVIQGGFLQTSLIDVDTLFADDIFVSGTLTAGLNGMKFGRVTGGAESTNLDDYGLRIDLNNYWKANSQVRMGNGTYYLEINPGSNQVRVKAPNLDINTSAQTINLGTGTGWNTANSIFLDGANNRMSLGNNQLTFTGGVLSVNRITAVAGSVAGWVINDTSISTPSTNASFANMIRGDTNVGFRVGWIDGSVITSSGIKQLMSAGIPSDEVKNVGDTPTRASAAVFYAGSLIATIEGDFEPSMQNSNWAVSADGYMKAKTGRIGVVNFSETEGLYVLAGSTPNATGKRLAFNHIGWVGSPTSYISGWHAAPVGPTLTYTSGTHEFLSLSEDLYMNLNEDGLEVIGDITATGDVISYSSSDINLKENIERITSGLDIIRGLNGYSYTWKDFVTGGRGGKTEYGLIAQEVKEVMPAAVKLRDDGRLALDYKQLHAAQIEAIKTLATRNESLEERVAKLEAIIEKLQ